MAYNGSFNYVPDDVVLLYGWFIMDQHKFVTYVMVYCELNW